MSIKEAVIAWVESYPEEDQKVLLEDLQQSGCVSGMVGPLVNYVDTIAFYEKHKEEINEIVAELSELMDDSFLWLSDAFDREDSLCLEQQNQNFLAWLGFEYVAGQLYAEKYEE